MLHEFLVAHQPELIERCRVKVLARSAMKLSTPELEQGIPLLIGQLIRTLQLEETHLLSRKISGSSGGSQPGSSEIGVTASRQGHESLKVGLRIDQVVHGYGDLCQGTVELAIAHDMAIDLYEFKTLNRCLDAAIADAVTEFAYQRDLLVKDSGALELRQRLGFLAHELRNLTHTATLAVAAIRSGNIGSVGATGAVLDRSLIGLRNLIDRTLADVRLSAEGPVSHELISVVDFIADTRISATLEAQERGCKFSASLAEPGLAVDADRAMLFAAVGNLLQNAFKFTKPGTEVVLSAYASGDRVLIDVKDECGGLPPGAAAKLFRPFTQLGTEKSGLGLGLAICRKSIEAINGIVRVRDVSGSGCVFTIDLPRHLQPSPAIHEATRRKSLPGCS